jgi:hypothetical protein
MPGMDGIGPMGNGPLAGRGRGVCCGWGRGVRARGTYCSPSRRGLEILERLKALEDQVMGLKTQDQEKGRLGEASRREEI